MQEVKEQIRQILSEAESPALLCSFGKDSLLLLHLCLEVKDIPLVWFHPFSTPAQEKFARRIIRDYDLTVWSWMPSDIYLVPNEEGISLIYEQSFGTQTLPGIIDVEDGQNCIFDFHDVQRTPRLFPHFDALLIGLKDSDSHPTLAGWQLPDDGWFLGQSRVFAPLRAMQDAEVWDAIRELNVEVDEERYADDSISDGEVQACTSCLQEGTDEVFCPKEQKAIARVAWQPQESLKAFRSRFGFKQAA